MPVRVTRVGRRAAWCACVLAAGLALAPWTVAAAADAKPDAKAAAADTGAAEKKSDLELPPLPADKTIKQSVKVGGRSVSYEATVGVIPVRNAKGKKIAEVVYTAYTVPGSDPHRPVTFAFNGGPGASSVYLNMGAIGPKRIQFGVDGDAPSDAAITKDNPNTWLDMTDLVFIDPVGTGFSRSLEDEDATKKDFYATEADIKYLSRVVYDWLVKHGRLRAPKYVMGESYGGYRAPRIAYALQTQMGVGVNGLVMVSPYLDPAAIGDGDALSPLPWMINLPSMTAAHLESQGKLTPAAMSDVENYVRTQYVTDFLAGRSDPGAISRMVQKVSAYTGLDPSVVAKLDGRVDIGTFLREVHRNDKKIGSVYDSNVTAFDPFPGSAERQSGDPILEALLAPTTSAMVDFVTREVGWKTDAHYEALSYAVNKAWDRGDANDKPVADLRKAIGNDPNMKALIVHGYNDLSCPFYTSQLILNQMPGFGQTQRVKLSVYPGGHMFYSRPASAASFKADAAAMYNAK
ncbi:S10 family peptidase [Dyella halodurans]|uniref:S10 family peptidase n=1 Tax=Dyella halodurans TaxID=1920171 RepID=A0ABV9C1S0_9GAMM|nr:peptidase S10 [Dyella halodurans]